MPRGPRVRAGLLMSRQMDFGAIETDVEALLLHEGLTLAPMSDDGRPVDRQVAYNMSVTVLPTAGVHDIEAGELAGLVIPGSSDARTPEAETQIDKLIATAQSEDVPVLAFGAGVARVLEAGGFESPVPAPPALMIHHGLRILETAAEVRDAVTTIRERQSALLRAA